jgi:peptidoglycan/LPS O-acetylase OafA/YrhL
MSTLDPAALKANRNAHLDVLRACAIVAVMGFHILQNSARLPTGIYALAQLGKYGVDLFFVLSGWLIGGLYWEERKRFGNVQLLRFWQRRWLRTLPLYLLILPVAYLSVYVARRQSFDLAYLFFAQNYRDTMPFFLISWSLCVEEHFYLILPLLLPLILAARRPGVWLGALLLLSFSMRLMDPLVRYTDAFGYSITATHLRLEGLLFGVCLSYCAAFAPQFWQRTISYAKWLMWPAIFLFLALPWCGAHWQFYCGAGIAAVMSAALLAAGIQSNYCARWPAGVRSAVRHIALWSYGIYMTHALVLNVFTKAVFPRLSAAGIAPEWIYLPCFLLMLLVGFCCYRMIELPAMRLRERWCPRRES